jgi:hypothetical protein
MANTQCGLFRHFGRDAKIFGLDGNSSNPTFFRSKENASDKFHVPMLDFGIRAEMTAY